MCKNVFVFCFVSFYWFYVFCSLYLITAQPFLGVTGATGGRSLRSLTGGR